MKSCCQTGTCNGKWYCGFTGKKDEFFVNAAEKSVLQDSLEDLYSKENNQPMTVDELGSRERDERIILDDDFEDKK